MRCSRFKAIHQKLEQQNPDDPASRFSYCLTGGDSNRGKRLFATHVSASCAQCHRVGDQGSAVGPDLTTIAQKRSPEHLLRSIVAPSNEIEPNYRSHFVQTVTGDSIQGLLKEETDDELVLVDQKGEEIRIPQEDIEEAAVQQISIMPEMLEVLEDRDIRDLVAYLKTLK